MSSVLPFIAKGTETIFFPQMDSRDVKSFVSLDSSLWFQLWILFSALFSILWFYSCDSLLPVLFWRLAPHVAFCVFTSLVLLACLVSVCI